MRVSGRCSAVFSAVLVGALMSGCAQPGRLLVVVESDLAVPSEIDCIQTSIAREGHPSEDVAFRLGPMATTLPLRVAVEPQGGSGSVSIDVAGSRGECTPGAPATVRARARVRIVAGSTNLLRLRLDRSCSGVLCDDPGQSCREGTCARVSEVASDSLPRVMPGLDAASGLDAPALDAGPAEIDGGVGCDPIEREIGVSVVRFGKAVDLSDDRCRILVSSPTENRAYVYVQRAAEWSLEAILRGAGEPVDFAAEVAIDGDGTVVAVTAPLDGSVRVFRRTGSSWVEERIIPDVARAVALDAAGDALFLAEGVDVREYRFDGTRWSPASSATFASDVTAVAVPADGSRFAVATLGELPRVCSRGPDWTCVSLPVTGATVPVVQSLAFSADGSTVSVGVLGDTTAGRVETFRFLGALWGALGPAVSGESSLGVTFGMATALDRTGDLLVVGSPDEDAVRMGPETLLGPGGTLFGRSVAVDPDGTLVVIGAPDGFFVRTVAAP